MTVNTLIYNLEYIKGKSKRALKTMGAWLICFFLSLFGLCNTDVNTNIRLIVSIWFFIMLISIIPFSIFFVIQYKIKATDYWKEESFNFTIKQNSLYLDEHPVYVCYDKTDNSIFIHNINIKKQSMEEPPFLALVTMHQIEEFVAYLKENNIPFILTTFNFLRTMYEYVLSNNKLLNLSVIFNNKPKEWGLCGDSYMWDYLQEYCKNIPFLYGKAKIEKIVKEQYEEKTGEELTKKSICYVEEFDHGGMSSGKIDGNFWIDTAIPLLIKNYKKENRKRWFYMKKE